MRFVQHGLITGSYVDTLLQGVIALAPELWRIGKVDKTAKLDNLKSHQTHELQDMVSSTQVRAHQTTSDTSGAGSGTSKALVDIYVEESKGTQKRLPVTANKQAVVEWGEAYFIGPTHDIVLCEKDGDKFNNVFSISSQVC